MTVQAILGTKGFEVISIEADAKLSDAIRVLTERHVGAVLVMKDHHIEGILSERDVVRVLGKHGASVMAMPVSEVMTRKVVTCRRADTAASIMER
ncbi:sugar isomerase, KpsF/GutQ family [Afipia felis]|uniref:Sugar isomerase, KpsF/GutQ family n=1 Tax=Afipia felis TaxID=1035 RepID=A0A090MJ75_AFIFE|nr:sugar isomerase, KpsF/GutQ family [Afipia felis]